MSNTYFFQNENKFIVGLCYEKINVDYTWNPHIPLDRSDEYGDIIPETNVYVGKYIKTIIGGFNDGRIRKDYFDLNGVENIVFLDFDGSTRYRQVDCTSTK